MCIGGIAVEVFLVTVFYAWNSLPFFYSVKFFVRRKPLFGENDNTWGRHKCLFYDLIFFRNFDVAWMNGSSIIESIQQPENDQHFRVHAP